MTTIDHRILISAPQHVVWNYVSNLANNPNWQVDCKNISFLTTHHGGEGTRYRYVTERGRDYVVEITAWYNQLGYEYKFVDGAPYASNKGRIRLQEVPEGTIVQWSFTYDLSGILGGMRNALGTKRSIDNVMVDSLWTLWRHVGQLSANIPPAESKALMRDAPDVEARAQYVPRHANTGEFDSKPVLSILVEPPVVEDDTRPRPVTTPPPTTVELFPPGVEVDSESALEAPMREPDFLAGIRDDDSRTTIPPISLNVMPPPTLDDTTPKQAISVEEIPLSQPIEEFVSPVEAGENYVPVDMVEPEVESKSLEEAPVPSFVGDIATSEPPIDKLDTASVSVFDLFGVPKPSETQQMEAVKLDTESRDESSIHAVVTVNPSEIEKEFQQTPSAQVIEFATPKRMGRRVRMRRQLRRVRQPR